MLDQIAFSDAVGADFLDELMDRVELMITWEDQSLFQRLASLVLFFLFNIMNEVLDQFQDTLAGPDLLPEVGRGKILPVSGIARTIVLSSIKWQKPCAFA